MGIYLVINPKLQPISVEFRGDVLLVPPKGKVKFTLSNEEVAYLKSKGLLIKKEGA